MRLASIRASGFRSFKDEFFLDNLTKVTAFVGRNNSGKSNLIELLKFLNSPQTWQGRFPDLAFRQSQDFSIELRVIPNPEERRRLIAELFGPPSTISEGAFLNDFLKEITHAFRFDQGGLIEGKVLITNVSGKGLLVWSAQPNTPPPGRPATLSVTSMDLPSACRHQTSVFDLSEHLEGRGEITQNWTFFQPPQTAAEPVPRALLDFYSKIHWVDTFRRSEPQQNAQERSQLSPSGNDLAQVWHHLASENQELLDRICDELNRVIRGIPQSSAPLRGTNATIRFKEAWGQTFSLPNSATGTQQTAIIVTKLDTGPTEAVFLVEEPEAHLHPGAQRRLRELLESNRQADQVFLTTHSTIFGLGGGVTTSFLVRRGDGASSVERSLAKDTALAVVLDLGYSHTDLLGHDLLLCVEGDSEMVAIPRLARLLDLDLEARGIGLFNLHGRGGVRRLPELLGYLHQINVRPFVVLDSEPDVPAMVGDLQRRNLLQVDSTKVWPADFEDLFGPTMIADACASLGYKGITATSLQGAPRIMSVLSGQLHSTGQSPLSKPDLADRLAAQCAADVTKIPSPIRELLEGVRQRASSFVPE
jgi:putative ATP-dependent endonuclease of the OLD family